MLRGLRQRRRRGADLDPVYWIDIPNGRIFRDPASGEHAEIYDGPMMGGFTMQQDGSLLLFLERGAIGVLRDGKLEYVVDPR